MADIEDDSNNISSASAGVDPLTVRGSQVHPEVASSGPSTVQLNDHENQEGATSQYTVTTVGEESDQGLSELLVTSSKGGVMDGDGCQEVISQILGTEVLTSDQNIITSYVQTPVNVEAAVSTETVSNETLQTLSPTTTIIYVQPDGSFVESSGLSAEEQQQLIEQLAKQQLVQVTGSEAVRIFEQSQAPKSVPTPPQHVVSGALASAEVQQVIQHVTKSQASVRAEQAPTVRAQAPQILQRTVSGQPTSYITLDASSLITTGQLTTTLQPQQLTILPNATQQLQSVAKHVTLQQNGSQLVQKKPVETVQIQLQIPPKQDIKGRQSAPVRIIQPQNLTVSQPLVKVSSVGTMSSPQIIHITPLAGQQQYFLQNPGEPPIQLLLQKSGPVMSNFVPVVHKPSTASPAKMTTVKRVVPSTTVSVAAPTPPAKGLAAAPTIATTPTTPSTPAPAPPKPPPQPPAVAKERPRVKNKPKKPQKIQTRSGRVSRPPKHKVKDYKFIKNEDLADSHQSDSDDYSEISVEEEDGEEGKKNTSNVKLALNTKAFKCETCDKAYIGPAGLNRHYRLNPTHGQPQPSQDGAGAKSSRGAGPPAETKANSSTITPGPGKPPPPSQKGQAGTTGASRGRGRPRGPGRPPERPRRVGRPPKRGRPGRPRKLQTAGNVEQQKQRRKAQLKEMMEQCDDEELMEVVLPRLTKFMTVWELILLKVGKGLPSKPQFPAVYREFELLHSQVKKMAQEHFSGAPQPALEVHNLEVLKSLGVQMNTVKLLNSGQGQQKGGVTQAAKNIRHLENTKMLPPAKRFKMENLPGETNGLQPNQNGIEKESKVDASDRLRKAQVSLTRLENLSPLELGEGGAAPGCSENDGTILTEDVAMETGVPNEKGEETQHDMEISEVLCSGGAASVDIADQVKELEQVLSTDLPHRSKAGTIEKCVTKDNQNPTGPSTALQAMAVGDTVEAQLIQPIAVVLGIHQVSDMASKADNSTTHTQAPEGIPPETVHTRLGAETEENTPAVQSTDIHQ